MLIKHPHGLNERSTDAELKVRCSNCITHLPPEQNGYYAQLYKCEVTEKIYRMDNYIVASPRIQQFQSDF